MHWDEPREANIANLTGLWKRMGVTTRFLTPSVPLHRCCSWPHRCWVEGNDRAESLAAMEGALEDLPDRSILPLWDWPTGSAMALERVLLERGYVHRSAQTAMVLDLEAHGPQGVPDAQVRRIDTPEDIDAWTDVCSRSFGYAIDGAVVRRLVDDPAVALYLIDHENSPAATALTLQTGNTIGVHQVGVPKEFRGKGLARKLMDHVMYACVESGSRYATLQASAAGAGIYRELGFVEQFEIRNYQRG